MSAEQVIPREDREEYLVKLIAQMLPAVRHVREFQRRNAAMQIVLDDYDALIRTAESEIKFQQKLKI